MRTAHEVGGNRGSTGRTRAFRWRQLGIPLGGALTASVALMVLAAPFAGATTALSWGAPFTGLAKTYSNSMYSSGCHSFATEPVTPAINTTSGQIVTWQHSAAGNCNSGAIYASTYTGLGFLGPKWTASSTTNVTVSIQYTMSWTARATAVVNGTVASKNMPWAESYLSLYAWIEDTTKDVFPANGSAYQSIAYLSTNNGTVFEHAWGANYWLNMTIPVIHGHWYTVTSEIDAGTYDSSSVCMTLAWSDMDLGSSGHSANLVSVTVS